MRLQITQVVRQASLEGGGGGRGIEGKKERKRRERKNRKRRKKEIHRVNVKSQISTTKRVKKHLDILNSRRINHFNF